MDKKKFSILTAAYNSARYLRDWADSILAQQYRPLEVVVVEDKSKDKTLKILKKLAPEFKEKNIGFKLIEPSNKLFCGSAYNLALQNATGNYFGILDSDDMLEDFACEYIVKLYEKYSKVTWIYTQYNKYNRTMDRIMKRGFCKYPGKRKSILQMERKNSNTYGHWRTFSNKINNMDNLFGKGLKCCVDKHLGIRLEEEGIGMFIDKVCYKYRTRSPGEKSIVHLYRLKDTRQQVTMLAKKRRKGKKVYPIIRGKV